MAHRCQYHCSGSGCHAESRYCLEPFDDDRFVAKTEEGRCEMYAETKYGVTIWQLALARERGALAFASKDFPASGAQHVKTPREAA